MSKSPQQPGRQNTSPSHLGRFPIVGVGASADGFDALRRLLEAVPEEPGFALVIVHHLARDKPSLAPDLLTKYTRMSVREVDDEPIVKPGHVYIIPPGQYLNIEQGQLSLNQTKGPRRTLVAIDSFFRTLAKDQRECAVGIVLSGTGSDGTLGVKAIKEAGGLVLAQEPGSAEHTGMPDSVINTGIVDQVLTPEAMPEALVRFAADEYICGASAAQQREQDLASDNDPSDDSQQSAATQSTIKQTDSEQEVKHADLKNLIAATDVATICLGTDLTIRWFTPATRELIRIKPADIGRPLHDLQNDFRNDNLTSESERVLDKLIPADHEVECSGDRVFLRRIVPYRTDDHRIDGVVITLIDVTRLRKREQELRVSERKLRELNQTLEQKVVQRTELLNILQHTTKIANQAKSIDEAMIATMDKLASYNSWRVGHVWERGDGAAHSQTAALSETAEQSDTENQGEKDSGHHPPAGKVEHESSPRPPRLEAGRPSQGEGDESCTTSPTRGHSVSTLSDDTAGSTCWVSSGIWHFEKEFQNQRQEVEEFQRRTEQLVIQDGEGMIGQVSTTGQPQQTEDMTKLSDTSRDRALALDLHGMIAFPITVDDEVVAIMEFFSEQRTNSEPAFSAMMSDVGIQLGHVIQRKRLERAVAQIANEEEQRIGRELHDGITQQLTGGALIAQTLRQSLPEDLTAPRENVEHLIEILRETHEDVSRLSRGLMPETIAAVDLLPALRGLIAETQQRYDINIHLSCEKFDDSFVRADSTVATIYQIARESLHNALKHSGSDRIDVEIATVDEFRFVVHDHGDGFDMRKNKPNCNGLRIMRFRAETIGGELTVQSAPGQGTRITLLIPKTRCQS